MTLGDYLVRVPTYLTSRCWNAQIAIADSRDFLILPSVMISLAIVATGTLDLGHGIIISRDDVGSIASNLVLKSDRPWVLLLDRRLALANE